MVLKEEHRSIWLTLNIVLELIQFFYSTNWNQQLWPKKFENNNAKFGDGYQPGVLLLKKKKIVLACFFCLIIYWLKASYKFLPLTINPRWRNGAWRIKLNWFDWTQSVCWNVQYKWQIMNILNIGQGLGMCWVMSTWQLFNMCLNPYKSTRLEPTLLYIIVYLLVFIKRYSF